MARHHRIIGPEARSEGMIGPEADRNGQTMVARRRGAIGCGLAVMVLASASYLTALPPARAQDTPNDAREKLDEQRRELDSKEKRAKTLQQDVQQLAETREKLNARLVETAALIQKSEARLSAIEARLGELDVQEKLLQGSLAQRHDQIAKLLSALLRMGRNPPPVMITRREDALEMVRSAMLLASAFPELREQALSLAGKLNELARVKNDIRTEGDRLKVETTRLTEARTRLADLMESKKHSLAERQAELEDVRKAAANISKSVGELSELIAQLDRTVKEKTGLGAYEESIKREAEQAAQQPVPSATTTVAAAQPAVEPPKASQSEAPAGAPSADASSKPDDGKPAETKVAEAKPEATPAAAPAAKETKVAVLAPPKPVIELAPSITGELPGNLGRIQPAIPFHLAKGKLPLPGQGHRVLSFGDRTQYGGASKGIVFETRGGAQITSPCDGWIVYAGEFRSYGQLLIINAGGGYHVLLAGLSQISAQPGQFVLAAEPIGTMSGVASAAKGQASSAPVLYVEFRKDGRPVDPDPWWVDIRHDGQQKVQG